MSKQKLKLFLTFNGTAEQAMNFYAKNLPNTKIVDIVYYGLDNRFASEIDKDRVLTGILNIMGQEVLFLDMDSNNPAPDFNFSISLFIDCANEAEFDSIFKVLAKDGKVLMGPEAVGELRKCAWVVDKFNVTWQPVWK